MTARRTSLLVCLFAVATQAWEKEEHAYQMHLDAMRVDWSKTEEEAVVTFPDVTHFHKFVLDHFASAALVLFYAPWSSHSKRFLPVWDEAAKKAKELSLDGIVQLAKVDASKNKDVVDDSLVRNIVSYPTIKLIRQGGVHELEKHGKELRTVDAILEEVRRQGSYREPEFLFNASHATHFVKTEPCAIIGFFKSDVVLKPEFKVFQEAAFELAGRCAFAWTATDFEEWSKKKGKMVPKAFVKNEVASALDFPVAEMPGLALFHPGWLRKRRAHFALTTGEPIFGPELDAPGLEQLEKIVEWFHANGV
jgi:thiol-disulfide isomerase/thioredoxin